MVSLLSIKRFLTDENAGTLTLTAVLMPLFLGFAGIGLDVTSWYMHKREAQNLSDMAVIDAVHSGSYFDENDLEAEVSSFLEDVGFDTATDTLAFNTPPTAGAYAGRGGFMEIVVSRQVPLQFLNAFYGVTGGDLIVTISSRAVAGTLTIGSQCVVALDPTVSKAIDVSGGADVDTGCGIAANSTAANAVYVGGSSTLTAASAQTVGDIYVGGSATLDTTTPPQSLAEPAPNPYADVVIPVSGSCDVSGNTQVLDDAIMAPGRYCGDITVKGSNVTFDPGTYILDGGSLKTNSGADFVGSDVTFIFTGSPVNTIGGVDMNGNTSAVLSAPTSGQYQGMLFVQDPDAPYRSASNKSKFNGGANLLLDGVIYFPSTDMFFSGGADADPSCMQIFAATVSFSGNSVIGNDTGVCTSLGIEVSPQVRIQLVE